MWVRKFVKKHYKDFFYPANSIPWPGMTWRRKKPRRQESWYWPKSMKYSIVSKLRINSSMYQIILISRMNLLTHSLYKLIAFWSAYGLIQDDLKYVPRCHLTDVMTHISREHGERVNEQPSHSWVILQIDIISNGYRKRDEDMAEQPRHPGIYTFCIEFKKLWQSCMRDSD